MVLLNTDIVKKFLNSIAFLDKKRPFTKEILMRIDMKKILKLVNYDMFLKNSLKYNNYVFINELDYNKYIELFN